MDESDDATVKLSPNCIHKRLHDKVYADNAKVFYKLDNMEVFKQLCSQAGQMGEILLSNWFTFLICLFLFVATAITASYKKRQLT